MRKQLEDYYPGDEVWRDSAQIARQQYWTDSPLQREILRQVNGDSDLAGMIYAKVGDGCLEWLHMRVPALAGRKPINCFVSEAHLRRLREALMRMD